MFWEHGHHVHVRVKDDGGQGRICSLPGYDQDWLSRTTFVSFVRQTQGLGLINQKLNSLVVVGIRLYGRDPDIISEHFGGGILLSHCQAGLENRTEGQQQILVYEILGQ